MRVKVESEVKSSEVKGKRLGHKRYTCHHDFKTAESLIICG
jgi:hypothetical protein